MMGLADALDISNKAPMKKPEVEKLDARIEALKADIETCNKRRKNLYEDFKDGILSKDEYYAIRDQYEGELNQIQTAISRVSDERDRLLSNGTGRQEWMDEVLKYKGVTKLSRRMLTFLIERIEVEGASSFKIIWRFDKKREAVVNALMNVKEAG